MQRKSGKTTGRRSQPVKGGSRMRTVSDLVELEVRAQEKSVGLFPTQE